MTDLPPSAVLIQELHDRQAILTQELQTLEDVRKQEARIKNELAHIATLLRDYPVPEHAQAHPEDLSLPAEALPDVPPAEACPADPSLLDYLDTILRERGPSSARELKRHLHDRFGLAVPVAMLNGELTRAKNVGHYAKRSHIWKLVSLHEAPTPGPPA